MAVTPNYEGFREAQDRLVENLGQSVVLLTPVATLWPVDTKLDPETLRPLDPFATPLASGFASAAASASVVFRPITTNKAGLESTAEVGPLGIKGSQSVALIMRLVDHPLASGATRAEVMGTQYLVEEVVLDGIREPDRVLVFLEER